MVARYPDDDVTIAVLFNTERPNAEVTPNDLEEQIARLVFATDIRSLERSGGSVAADRTTVSERVSPSAGATFASADELQRYAGQYRDGSRLVRLTPEAGALMMRPGLRRREASQLIDTGGGAFVAADDPSFELRFHVRDDQSRGYARYRNGWFASVAVRSAPSDATRPPRSRN